MSIRRPSNEPKAVRLLSCHFHVHGLTDEYSLSDRPERQRYILPHHTTPAQRLTCRRTKSGILMSAPSMTT